MALWPTNQAWTNGGTNFYRNANCVYFLPSNNEWYKAAYYDPNKNNGTGGYWLYPTGSSNAPTAVASGTAAGTAVYNQSAPASVFEAGGLSPYGTMGQGGNVGQWLENEWVANNRRPDDPRGYPAGASWSGSVNYLKSSFHNYTGEADKPSYSSIGFRVGRILP
jgi:hypothetical protein